MADGEPLSHDNKTWLDHVRQEVERAMLNALCDDDSTHPSWQTTAAYVREMALRPAKRVRPALLVSGFALGRGRDVDVEGIWRFAAGLELLHLFMLIHDDVADRAPLRRGGPSLHAMLGGDRVACDLAVVTGDHLFARALEVMLDPELTFSSRAVRYYLQICRETAVGQFLDLGSASRPLAEAHLFSVLRIAQLKTARYSFVGPLVAGGLLAGAPKPLIDRLERVGRHLGVAYQLRDDQLGLFGDERVAGKSAASDFAEGKKTYPIIAAYVRSDDRGRAELDELFKGDRADPRALARVREIVIATGGLAATERAIDRATRAAAAAVKELPNVSEPHRFLNWALTTLARRSA